jgi:hypothetical protein
MMKTKLTLFVTALAAALFVGGCASTESNQPLFKIIEGSFAWQEAREDAESKGGRLAVLDTKEKIVQVNSYVRDYKGAAVRRLNAVHLWIGLTDRITEDKWRWITGTDLGVNNWAENEPNEKRRADGVAQDYGVIMGPGAGPHHTGWHDDVGGNKYSYLIEFPIQLKK